MKCSSEESDSRAVLNLPRGVRQHPPEDRPRRLSLDTYLSWEPGQTPEESSLLIGWEAGGLWNDSSECRRLIGRIERALDKGFLR